MKALLTLLLTLVGVTWGWDLMQAAPPTGAHPLWTARQQFLTLSGFLSIALMSLTMFLATRPAWLESPLGGMDRVYRTHKWAGILAVVFAALHWLIEMSSDVLKAMIGRAGRLPKETFTGLLEILRDLAGDMGEWAIYAVLAMLAITLWKKFPYRIWRILHRAMPVLYLMLAFHAALLAPQGYWLQPAGVLLAVLLMAGMYGAVRSLLGGIGRSREATGRIVAIEHPASDLTTVRCHLERRDPKARQIWIAGGIGVTPFLAWLESLQSQPDQAPAAELHYCTRDQQSDAFVPRLQALCATLPGVHLHIHGARQGNTLKAAALHGAQKAEIWFCGPNGLATSLREGLHALGARPRFHQEAFEMR